MDKKKLLAAICVQLEKDLQIAKEAALATYDAATNEESKAENEYDTRGLEASYLAGAQAERVRDIEAQLNLYKLIELKNFNATSPIGATALIEVDHNERKSYILLMPKGGGFIIKFEGQNIQIVTPASPLGEALVGLKQGDTAVVETANNVKEYDIISVS